jgi:transposase-like protein
MARQRSHSIEFKRQVAQEFVAGETLYALAKRHDISRQLIRVWVQKYEAGGLDEDAQAAELLQEYRIQDRSVGAHGWPTGPGDRVSKGGAEKRTAAAKRDYIRYCRPDGISMPAVRATARAGAPLVGENQPLGPHQRPVRH